MISSAGLIYENGDWERTRVRALAVTVAFLLAMAWRYRKNTALLLVIIATLFADLALMSTQWKGVSDWPLRILSVSWLVCMLMAGVFSIMSVPKKKMDRAGQQKMSGTR
jgi:hypothetical protein